MHTMTLSLWHVAWFRSRSMCFAMCLTALAHFVSDILGVCTEPQMGRINTRRIISIGAIVKSVQSIGNWAKVNLPRNSMCAKSRTLTMFPHSKLTIAVANCVASPKPTGISFLYLLPKQFFNCLAFAIVPRTFVFHSIILVLIAVSYNGELRAALVALGAIKGAA